MSTDKKTKRKNVVVSKEEIIKEASKRLNLFEEDIASILNCAEEVIEDYLNMADNNTNITVYGMNNVHFYSKWMDARLVAFQGKDIFYDEGPLFEAKFLPSFRKQQGEIIRKRIAIAEVLRNLGADE